MRCPTLSDLPPASHGKTDWPWTEESPRLQETMPDGSPWPRISIVTPSYNQGQFIEETIRSVLLQGYPNLEYIIIDGGSTDNSVEIIKKYERWLAYWVSEPDRGQSHAINKGFEQATGEIMAWINSDDYYASNAFVSIAQAFSENETRWVAADCETLTPDGSLMVGWGRPKEESWRWFLGCLYPQPGIFWRSSLWKSNKIDENLQYSFDYDLWMQFSGNQTFPTWLNTTLAFFRWHERSKTATSKKMFMLEDEIVRKRYLFRIKSLWMKAKIRLELWFLHREKQANAHLSIRNKNGFFLFRILLGLLSAPWYLFQFKFYYRVKRMLVG